MAGNLSPRDNFKWNNHWGNISGDVLLEHKIANWNKVSKQIEEIIYPTISLDVASLIWE